MRIGFSTSVIQRGKTGIAQYVFALLRAFEKLACPHRFFLFTLEEDRHFFTKLSSRFEIVAVPEKYRNPLRNILWHQISLPDVAKKLDLDVLHVPSYRRLIWRGLCPRVATIHDLAPFHVSKKYDLARMIYGRVVVKHLARAQEEIIAVSENTSRDLQRFFGIPAGRIKVIHNGLDHERFFPRGQDEARERVRTKYKVENPFFLYLARLEHPGKNHLRLIEAFEQFKKRTRSEWHLALGGSDWHGAEEIHKRIAQSPFRTEIKTLGFVADEELPWLYAASETFIYPSLYEGFGMPPVEAMACGCPVICSANGSLGEVVGRAAIIINPVEVMSMTKGMELFYSSTEARAVYRRNGLARAAEFSWERAAEETLRVYTAAIAGKKKFALSEVQTLPAPAGPVRSS